MEDEDVTVEQVLAELDEYLRPLPKLPPGAITISDYMRKYQTSDKTARKYLLDACDAGVLKEIECRSSNGHRCKAYVKVSDNDRLQPAR